MHRIITMALLLTLAACGASAQSQGDTDTVSTDSLVTIVQCDTPTLQFNVTQTGDVTTMDLIVNGESFTNSGVRSKYDPMVMSAQLKDGTRISVSVQNQTVGVATFTADYTMTDSYTLSGCEFPSK